MIQGTNIKAAIDPKLLQEAGGKLATGEEAQVDLEFVLENQDFANELLASLGQEAQVQPVQVSPEQVLQKPSSLIGLPHSGQTESISPKIFDPELTQGVEKLIQPQASNHQPAIEELVAKLVKGEALTDSELQVVAKGELKAEVKAELQKELGADLAQKILKTPQTNHTGRAPAIDFAKTEIDPQLMNLEDFVLQKNLVNKKNIQGQAYGMVKGQQQQAALENGLKSTQVVKEVANAEAATPQNSQQFILNMLSEQNSNTAPQMNEVQAPQKVFNMAQIKTAESNEIMNQISDYIVQAKAAKEPTVNMRMNHDQLGMIDITVSKTQTNGTGINNESIAINIGAHSADGKSFFQQNSKDLFSHLSSVGINVADIKVETPTTTAKNDFDFSGQQNRQSSHQDKQFGSEQNQRRHESDRRQNLWDLLKDQEAA